MTESNSGAPQQPRTGTRHFPRYRIDVRVLARVQRAEGAGLLRGRSTDISESGMGVTLSGDLHPGDAVELEFSLPFTREPLHLRAVVRRRHGLNYGVEFLTLSPQQRAAIQRLHEPLASN